MKTSGNTEERKEGTRIVQAVVPVSVASAIESEAKEDQTSDSHVIRRILSRHYAKRMEKGAAR